MPEQTDLNKLFTEAQTALKEKNYDHAAELLRQILLEDEDYKDASRLLAQTIRLKRRRWYNDPRVWGGACALVVVTLLIWLVPRIQILSPVESTADLTMILEPTATTEPTQTVLPSPTSIPLTWKRISIGQEFERDTISAIVVDPDDPDVVYVGMRKAGVYKSIDGGLSFKPSHNGIGNTQIESLVIDHKNPNILFAGSNSDIIYKSEDAGMSWHENGQGIYLWINPNDSSHMYSRNYKQIYETTNGGDTWELSNIWPNCPEKIESWSIHPQDSEIILIGDQGPRLCKPGLYRSEDGGRSWDLIGFQNKWVQPIAIGEQERENNVLYAMHTGDVGTGLHISYDNGNNWSQKGIYCDVLTIDEKIPSNVYCADNDGGLLVTRDNGHTWNAFPVLKEITITAIYIDHYDNEERIYVAGEKLHVSSDGGSTWKEIGAGLGSTRAELKIFPGDSSKMFLSTNFGTNDHQCSLFRSLDGGISWSKLFSGGYLSWCGPAIDGENTLYVIHNNIIKRSSDNGSSWVSLSSPDEIGWLSANPFVPKNIIGGTFISNEIYYSTDAGKTWDLSAGLDKFDPIFINARLYFEKNGNTVYAIGGNDQYISSDRGISWEKCDYTSTSFSDSRLVIDPRNPNRLLLATNHGVEISVDYCKSWVDVLSGTDNQFINTIAIDPNQPDIVYAGTQGGIYISSDFGVSWHEINDGLLGANVVYSIVVDDESNVYAATPYGIFQLLGK